MSGDPSDATGQREAELSGYDHETRVELGYNNHVETDWLPPAW